MHVTAALTTRPQPEAAAEELLRQLGPAGENRRAVLLYATVQYDLAGLCRHLAEGLAGGVVLAGCSTQGVVGPGAASETGFIAGAMAFHGDEVRAAAAVAEDLASDTAAKAGALATGLRAGLGRDPRLVVPLYDPLAGADVGLLIERLRTGLPGSVLIGAAASQPWGPMVETFQFHGGRVLTRAAVALGLDGDFEVTTAQSSGAVPTGFEMKVTRAVGNRLLELDGQPALQVWLEVVGAAASTDVNDTAAWAIGVRRGEGPAGDDGDPEHWSILTAFAFDPEQQAVILPIAVPPGTLVMFHHRTVEAVYQRALEMAGRVVARLEGRAPLAVLGFECGGRASPFLGAELTRQENLAMQAALAPGAPWLGMLAWGEIADRVEGTSFCNYTYPLAVLTAPR